MGSGESADGGVMWHPRVSAEPEVDVDVPLVPC